MFVLVVRLVVLVCCDVFGVCVGCDCVYVVWQCDWNCLAVLVGAVFVDSV